MANNKKVLIGAHLSIAGGIWKIQERMEALNATTCALFLKNQRRFAFTPLEPKAIQKFKMLVKNADLLVPHGSYLINMARSCKEERKKHFECFRDDVARCSLLGIKMYNVHPGSDVDNLGKKALANVAEAINEVNKIEPNVTIVIENMAGQGRVLCSNFGDIRDLIELVHEKSKIGVCLDTAHLFGSGYDLQTKEACEKTFGEFDRVVGLRYLKAMHLNDSKEELGSKKDRHESLGLGKIGIEAFKFIMKDKRFEDIPKVLETPDISLYKKEIAMLRGFAEENK
ncbi:apurinic endonuclease (APN1) [Vavraia culicis subsp. floridensis]|uniref:Apurinic-apyrimidinic endonuclease 1 n=1 Tax=Vavraia culicis (isolate floridensis) TaxID=948595 RepID=L2GZA7_VAVCU|nr:apurinic endonuclease (APN1) [Vavraia culicis subsp. floridensis]ELA48400.1 apurinic endonuclease (APN1) [Vavraia culicis subsp. floridensis]